MTWLLPAGIAVLISTTVLTSVYFYLYRQEHKRFLLIWAASWAVYMLRFLCMITSITLGPSIVLDLGYHLAAIVSGVLLLWGSHLFLGRRFSVFWIYGAVAVGLFVTAAIMLRSSFLAYTLPNFFFLALVYIWTGTTFIRHRLYEGAGSRLVGWSFILWGLHKADYPFLRQVEWFAPWGYIISSVLELTIAVGMLLVYFQTMKKELLAKEEKFRLLAENASDIIYRYRLAPTPGFDYVSPSVTALTGYTPEEHYADSELGLKIVHPDDLGLLRKAMREPEREKTLVVRWLHRSGAVLWTEQRNVPVYDEEGRIIAIEGIARDITERKRAEETAREHEQRFRDFLENVQHVALMLNQDGRITFCNSFLLNLTGWSPDEVVGRDWFSTFLPENIREDMRKRYLSSPADFPRHYENPILTRNGEERLIVWDNTGLRDRLGHVVGVASLGIDVTEHRRLEEQLRQAQKMEAIGQLAGGVAHDFNNILSAIMGYAHMLKMKLDADDPLRVNVDHILDASDKAANLTHSLLAFSRKQTISIRPVELNELIRKVSKLLNRLIGEDIALKTDLAEEKISVMADPGQLEQALMNLATNARDAMPSGGTLTIGTGIVRFDVALEKAIEEELPGDYAHISVSDTGSGMDDKIKQKIFEPFFTTKEMGRGTGLGLAMVYGIVKQHSGYINVQSEPGRGTTINIYLPAVEKEDEPAEKAGQEASGVSSMPRGTETILVAEDDAALRRLSTTVLREFGYTVIEAEDGEEAVRKFMENSDSIRLVLFDMIMPRKNGREAYEEIVKIRPGVKALFVSGYTADIMEKKGLQGRDLKLILKPVSPADLLRKVREALDEKE